MADTIELFVGTWGAGRATSGSHTIDLVDFPTLPGQAAPVQFTPADVGCPILIVGAGAVDPLMPPIWQVQGATLSSVITAYNSPTSVDIADAAVTSLYNSGFRNIAVFRKCGMLFDSWALRSQITQSTRDSFSFTALQTDLYFVRNQVMLLGQPVYLRSTEHGDLFGGLIDSLDVTNQPQPTGGGLLPPINPAGTTPFAYVATCTSWDSIPSRRRVHSQFATTYKDTADVVMRKLCLTNLSDEGTSFSGPVGPLITLQAPAGAVVQDLMDACATAASQASGQSWYHKFDAFRNCLFAPASEVAAPWDVDDFTGSDDNVLAAVTKTTSHDQLFNTVMSLGSSVLLGSITTVFEGTATQPFQCPAQLQNPPTITLNGSPQTVGVAGVDTGKDWYWSQGSSAISGTDLGAGDELVVIFQPSVAALAIAYNNAGLQGRALVEGPGYAYEDSIDVTTPIEPADLYGEANQIAQQNGIPPVSVSATTLRGGLATGQLQHIRLEDIAVDDDFLITEVKLSSVNNLLAWQYTALTGYAVPTWLTAFTQFINRGKTGLANLLTPSTAIVPTHRITIDHTKVAGTSDKTNFVFLFTGTYDFLAQQPNGSVVYSDGADIYFSTNSDQSGLLDFDLAYYDPTTGAIAAWIRIPVLSHTVDTVIFIQYGDPSVSVSLQNGAGTWSPNTEASGVPSANWRGVYHLSETAGPYADKTQYGHNSTGSLGAGYPARVAGPFGWAIDLVSTYSGIALPSSSLVGNGFSNYKGSLAIWLKTTTGFSLTGDAFDAQVASSFNHGLAVGMIGGAGQGVLNRDGSLVKFDDTSVIINDGNWHLLVVTMSDLQLSHLFVDGVLVASSGDVQNFAMTATNAIELNSGGRGNLSFEAFVGQLAEPRITQVDLDADTVATMWHNQHSPSTFYSLSLAASTGTIPQPDTHVVGNPVGTVTHTTGALTAGGPVVGNGGGDIKPGVAGQFVPAGGTANQVLTKNTGTDYDTSWKAASNPSVHDEPLTDGHGEFIFAAGDVIVVVGIPN